MANEEAREARVSRLLDVFWTARGDGTKGSEILNAVMAVADAGRAEGRRQAREAVVSVMDEDEDPGTLDSTERNDNLVDALAAIDALGEDDRG